MQARLEIGRFSSWGYLLDEQQRYLMSARFVHQAAASRGVDPATREQRLCQSQAYVNEACMLEPFTDHLRNVALISHQAINDPTF